MFFITGPRFVVGGVVQDREAGVKEEFMNGEWGMGQGDKRARDREGQAESMKGSGEVYWIFRIESLVF